MEKRKHFDGKDIDFLLCYLKKKVHVTLYVCRQIPVKCYMSCAIIYGRSHRGIPRTGPVPFIHVSQQDMENCCATKMFKWLLLLPKMSWITVLYVSRRKWCYRVASTPHLIHSCCWPSHPPYPATLLRIVRNVISRDDSSFPPSQWETLLLCNDVSHWLGPNLESVLSSV